ncbi:MAG TPA: aspartyl/asparaginyl beta-hydroxylase domain-containing protein [Mucilaginibacter sp.]
MICYAKLPLSFDINTIQHEFQRALLNHEWLPHYNTRDYNGNWDILPLRSPGGHPDKPYANLLNEEGFEDTTLLTGLPAIQVLLDGLKCEKLAVRLLNLRAGAVIKAHKDAELAFEKGEARLHFPLFTNDGVEFYVEDERIYMREGESWYINANLMHRVANNSETDRIHLVVDCKVNEWLTEILEQSYKKCKDEVKDISLQLKIIEQLRWQNTPHGNTLADQLEQEIPMSDVTRTMLNFIKEIGLTYHLENIEGKTFLPGLKLRNGSLVVDLDKLLYPGDILHEAGHLACMPVEIRAGMSDDLENNNINQGGEMMAIAWSYAACLHLDINPEIVFHENGYKGGSKGMIENFSQGRYIGVPLLIWCGMTTDEQHAAELNSNPFPAMLNWTCQKNMFTT